MNGLRLDIKQEKWSKKAAAWLKSACDDDYTINDLKSDIDKDNCALFNVYQNDAHIASMVLRIDNIGNTKDLVVVAAGGYAKGFSLYEQITPFCKKLAAGLGCKRLRGHCQKRSIGRLMERAGWSIYEYVFEVEVA